APGSPSESIPRGPRVLPRGRDGAPRSRRGLHGAPPAGYHLGRAARSLLGQDALGQDAPRRFPWPRANGRLHNNERRTVGVGLETCTKVWRWREQWQWDSAMDTRKEFAGFLQVKIR